MAEDVLGNKEFDTCKVIVEFNTEDQTYVRSSGGSSGGSGGSSDSSAKKKADETVLTGAITGGKWMLGTDGTWTYELDGKKFVNQWAYIFNPYATGEQERVSWFRFDENGRMLTGWFQDPADQCWYYLHPLSDGSQGCMYTGGHVIDGTSYFFGTDGRMATS